MIRFVFSGILIQFFMGCSSCALKEKCENTNWYQYGYDTAMKGLWPKQDSFIGECRKAQAEVKESDLDRGFKAGVATYCSEEQVMSLGKSGRFLNEEICNGPELRKLKEVHAKGVRTFCQPSSAYSFGLAGGEYNQICPKDLESDFLYNYKPGRKLYLENEVKLNASTMASLSGEISKLEYERSALQGSLNNLPPPRRIWVKEKDPSTGEYRNVERTEDRYESQRRSYSDQIYNLGQRIEEKRRLKQEEEDRRLWLQRELLKVSN